jgi:hypothetical protein
MPAMLVSVLLFIALYGQADATFFSIVGNPHYPRPRATLERLVAEKGEVGVNHFHVIGYRFPDGSDLAWVYWVEDRSLILWEPTAYPEYPVKLSCSRRYLNLDRDIVEMEDDLKGSTYLETKAWANSVIEESKRRGSHYVITKPHG